MGETRTAPSGGEKRGIQLRVLGVKYVIGAQNMKFRRAVQYGGKRN